MQALSAADFLDNGFRNSLGERLPTYFPNGPYLNLSVSVYLQVVPVHLFGLSEFATRATSVLVALSGSVAVGLTLRDAFRVRFWWVGTLLLAATPAWFLHSRTAFETVLATSFYAWFLYFYFRVERSGPRNLFPALLFAALAFYAYAATQIVVAASLVALAVSDVQLFRRNPRLLLGGIAFLALLFVPYARFYAAHADEISAHLRTLGSYWVADLTLGEKLGQFLREYAYGLSPRFWYTADNTRDLDRHQMQGWGHILAVTLPFAVFGALVCLRKLRSRAHRGLLLATLACPLGGALVETGVTRDLVFVVPAALLTALGVTTLLTALAGRVRYAYLAAALFIVLAGISMAMLRDAVVNGPTWYRDYGLYGLQYGGRQVTSATREYLAATPEARITLTPTWANGTDVVVRFFLGDEDRVRLGSIVGHQLARLPLDENDVFVMTQGEYGQALRDHRFTDVRVARTLPFPDGRPGFYFVRLRYSARADAIFAAERRERSKPRHTRVRLDGSWVDVTHSLFDIGEIKSAFDGDSYTLVRTFEANPAVVRLTFPRGRTMRGISVKTGMSYVGLRVSVVPVGAKSESVFTAMHPRENRDPELAVAFGRPIRAGTIEIRVRDPGLPEPAHVHIRDIKLLN